jgi:hypothetical protein
MDHHEKHHEHHRKEREEEKHHEHLREREAERKPRVIHPYWFVVLGIVLIAGVILTWIFAAGAFRAG